MQRMLSIAPRKEVSMFITFSLNHELHESLGSLFQHDPHLSQMTPGEDGEGSPPPDFY